MKRYDVTPSGYATTIETLGFPAPVDVRERYGIGGMYPNVARRTGIYLLVLADAYFYIGQARDVVRRFAQHRKTFGARIVAFSFISMPLKALNAAESRLIREGEKGGLPLEQTDWKSQIYGSSDLDVLFDGAEYATWLANPAVHFAGSSWPLQEIEPGRASRDRQSFDQMLKHQNIEDLLDALRVFVVECIPAAKTTVPDYWSISCLPSTNRSTYPRLICVSAHVMEILVIGHEKNDKATLWGFLVVARSPLEEEYGSLDKAAKALKLYIDAERPYKSAGVDQCRIDFEDLDQFRNLLKSEVARRAAGRLMYNVMRKGVNRYAKYHCTALASAILVDR